MLMNCFTLLTGVHLVFLLFSGAVCKLLLLLNLPVMDNLNISQFFYYFNQSCYENFCTCFHVLISLGYNLRNRVIKSLSIYIFNLHEYYIIFHSSYNNLHFYHLCVLHSGK
jgi:hypothetical protein